MVDDARSDFLRRDRSNDTIEAPVGCSTVFGSAGKNLDAELGVSRNLVLVLVFPLKLVDVWSHFHYYFYFWTAGEKLFVFV